MPRTVKQECWYLRWITEAPGRCSCSLVRWRSRVWARLCVTARFSDTHTEADFLVIIYQPWLHWTKDYLKLTWLKLYIVLLSGCEMDLLKQELCEHIFFKVLIDWLIYRERKGERKGEGRKRERCIDLLFCSFMHSLIDSCMCPGALTGNRTHNRGVLGWHSNQLSSLDKACEHALTFLMGGGWKGGREGR